MSRLTEHTFDRSDPISSPVISEDSGEKIAAAADNGVSSNQDYARSRSPRVKIRPMPPAWRELRRVARVAFANAIRRRAIVRKLNCERCGRPAPHPEAKAGKLYRLAAHHNDYSKPLDVEWLCHWCHITANQEVRAKMRADLAATDAVGRIFERVPSVQVPIRGELHLSAVSRKPSSDAMPIPRQESI